MDIKLIRTRWAAVGAAVAITLGAGGIGITQATTSSGERAIYTPINPCRLADLRPAPDTVGTRTAGLGPDETYTLDGWGAVGDCTLPSGTSGLALNVTAVTPTAPTFLRLWPAGEPQPTTSNLNPAPGQPPTPNAVNVGLSATGQFSIFNRFGIVNVIIDVVGAYDDHNHDDRYYTKTDADAAHATKANASEVIRHGDIVMSHATTQIEPNSTGGATVQSFRQGAKVGAGNFGMSLNGPVELGGVAYGLKSVEYCFDGVTATLIVSEVIISGGSPAQALITDRTDRAPGCHKVNVNNSTNKAFDIMWTTTGTGTLRLRSVQTTWAPAASLR